jgi:RNA polymerase sigma-70 factor (ECF subfamily)
VKHALSLVVNSPVVTTDTVHLHADLIERCRGGDQQAHYRLYTLYARAMFNVAFRIVGNDVEAEDVLQEAFINAFRNLDNYRGEATFGAWLKRIVINKAINVLKQRKAELWPEDEELEIAEAAPDEEYLPELTVDRVREAIEQLPDGYRSVVSLYLVEGYDHQEIAGILGITESTSKSQLNRAKLRLRQSLAKFITE